MAEATMAKKMITSFTVSTITGTITKTRTKTITATLTIMTRIPNIRQKRKNDADKNNVSSNSLIIHNWSSPIQSCIPHHVDAFGYPMKN